VPSTTSAPPNPETSALRRASWGSALGVLVVLGALILGPMGGPPSARGEQAQGLVEVDAGPGVPADVLVDVRRTAPGAWSRVVTVWGATTVPPRVHLVAGPDALATAAGRPLASVSALVALTTPDRVLIESTAYTALAPAGRQVVLTHELTHLATGAAADPQVPIWLEEGFADYIGFLDSAIPITDSARAAIDQVRRHGPLTQLPREESFSAGPREQAVAYAEAWLMCRWIAERYGQDALVATYRAVAHGRAGLSAAIQQVTGQPLRAAVDSWSLSVSELAR